MSEPKLISPMLDNFAMGCSISDHHGVRCYPAMEEKTGNRFIVKVISIPASRTQLDALLLTGAFTDEASAQSYFKELADGVVDEVEILKQLSHLEGFVPYENYQLEQTETGYDVYLLSTYQLTLARQFKRQPLTHLGAINLGLDLCAALTVCRRAGYLYVDLKPSNIYVTGDKAYHIGDLGFLRLDSLKYTSLPDKYRSQYTAPEIADAYSALNTTMDVYAAGLILYQTYNDGVLPFTGDAAPAEQFPAPAYADYEMSEIILKACAPDPADRWEDPMQMGQALVSYMQRNGANDTLIVPPVVPAEDVAADEAEESSSAASPEAEQQVFEDTAEPVSDDAEAVPEDTMEEAAEEAVYNEDDFENLSFLLDGDGDETDPAFEQDEIDYQAVSDETSEMLVQADEIANHPIPDPVVAPEPVEIPMPEPIPVELPEETNGEPTDTIAEEAQEEAPEDTAVEKIKRPKKKHHWIRNSLLSLLALLLIAGCAYYYVNYYLQPIDAIVLNGNEDTLTVQITSNIDESLLTVICADPHGNQITANVIDGIAEFTDLVPDTAYTIKVKVAGFHRLTGHTSKAYSTPVQSNIVQFNAVTGAEEGSAILSFTVDGPDSEQWRVVYSAEGENEKTVSFPSHMVTLTGLTVGKEYRFRLIPETELYLTGTSELTFLASKLTYARNLQVTECINGQLTVVWDAPQDTVVDSWSVRCYNENGYNETIITSQTTAVFENIVDTDAYTVEVTAAGMSVNQRIYIPKNSIIVSNFQLHTTATDAVISWESSRPVNENGWLVSYTVNGMALNDSLHCPGNTVTLSGLVPGATYQITVKQSDEADALGGVFGFTAADAEKFSGEFGDAYVSANNMGFYMCRHPLKSNWDVYDLSDEDYTSRFAVGEKAAFLVGIDKYPGYSDASMQILFTVTDSDGKLIGANVLSTTWDDMWYRYYCELDIPFTPNEPGSYTITVYFNGEQAHRQSFTITD